MSQEFGSLVPSGLPAARVKRLFSGAAVPAVVLFSGEIENLDASFQYFSGVRADNCVLVLKKTGEGVILSSELNAKVAAEQAPDWLEVKPYNASTFKRLFASELRDFKVVGADFRTLNARRYRRLEKLGKRIRDAFRPLRAVRAVKDEWEVKQLAQAQKESRRIILDAGGRLNSRWTELDVKKFLLRETVDAGLEPAFAPIVAANKATSFPHYEPRDRKLDGIVMIDYGVKFNGYCGDMTRCFFLGSCKEEKELYKKVRKAHDQTAKRLLKFSTGRQAATFAKQAMLKLKLPPLPHALGHGVGLEVHETPSLSLHSKDYFKPGMAFTLEPGAYLKNFGARFENVLVREKDGVRLL